LSSIDFKYGILDWGRGYNRNFTIFYSFSIFKFGKRPFVKVLDILGEGVEVVLFEGVFPKSMGDIPGEFPFDFGIGQIIWERESFENVLKGREFWGKGP